MILYPAIDILDGKVVRLTQGSYDRVTISGNPIDGYSGAVAGANAWIFNGDNGQGNYGRALYRPWTTTGSFDTNDEWITTRVGIKERRLLKKNVGSSYLGIQAVNKLLQDTGTKP